MFLLEWGDGLVFGSGVLAEVQVCVWAEGGGNLEGGRQKWGLQCFGKGPAKSGFFGRGGAAKKKPMPPHPNRGFRPTANVGEP